MDMKFKNDRDKYINSIYKPSYPSTMTAGGGIMEGENNSNNENKILKDFSRICKEELQIKKFPKIKFLGKDSKRLIENSWADFNPNDNSIRIIYHNRHIADILRSLAHELTHFSQNINGKIKDNSSGETGSEIENEANYKAGIIMRKLAKCNNKLFE